jgi:predicted PurR-regulated permease PerM
MLGGMARMVTFALVPLLAFYLLSDSSAIEASASRFIPDHSRASFVRLRGAVDRALQSYVRGQAIVCLVMGGAVGIGLAAIRHPAALLLAVLVGAAEIIPYVGFTLAAIAIVLAGWTVSPLQALLGVGLYVVINWAVGTFVTPSVMGRHLEMHPFLVTVSVIAGAQLMGPAGALLALPAAAALQAVVAELARPSAAATASTQ